MIRALRASRCVLLACLIRLGVIPLGLLFSSSSNAQMTWEIVNRFPMLSESSFRAIVENVGTDPVGMENRLIGLNYRDKIKHLDGEGPAGPAWTESWQRYDRERILSPSVQIKVKSKLGGGICTWTLTKDGDSMPVVQRPDSCLESMPFNVDIGSKYTVQAARQTDTISDEVTVEPKKHLVVVVGDSFASGEGNPDYPAVYKKLNRLPSHDWATNSQDKNLKAIGIVSARWMDTICHRSLLAWSSLYALRMAISQPDTVVQYVSFACSGAEVLDGFLLPQRDPPGTLGVEPKQQSVFHSFSQQQALAKFLCGSQSTFDFDTVSLPKSLWEYQQRYDGGKDKPRIYRCANPIQPDELLFQLGGNDTRFSGVVRHVIYPNQLKFGRKGNWLQRFGGKFFLDPTINWGLRKAMSPISPKEALKYVAKLDDVYDLLDRGFNALKLDSKTTSIKMLLYPDPTVSKHEGEKRRQELMICNARTRDGNRPMQSLIAESLGWFRHDAALMGVSPKKLLDVKTTYIPKLRQAQLDAIFKHTWQPMDSTPAMVGYGLCAGSLECDEKKRACDANRVRWNYPPRQCFNSMTPPWMQLADFDAYDPARDRGLRYANDALLASVRIADDQVLLDWIIGAIHPTANVHARIASNVDVKLTDVSAASPKTEPALVARLVPKAKTWCPKYLPEELLPAALPGIDQGSSKQQ